MNSADLQFLTLKTIIIRIMTAAVPTMSMIVTATRRPRMAAVSRVVGDEVIIVAGAALRE